MSVFLTGSLGFVKGEFNMKSKLKRLYIHQLDNKTLEEGIKVIEKELNQTSKDIEKMIYQYYEYTLSYAIPFFDGEIKIFPIDTSFTDSMLPARYTTNDFPNKYRETMVNLNSRGVIGDRASFIIEFPEGVSTANMSYAAKLLGICFGGYFAPLEELPRHGMLNKREHIYIEAFRQSGDDVISRIEMVLEEQTKKVKKVKNKD